MITRSRLLMALCVTAGLATVPALAADTTAAAGTDAAPVAGGHHGHWGHHSEFRHVLHRLNLTPEQKTQIKTILAQAKTTYGSRHADVRANHEALTATSPNDPGYPALLATEKANAAARVQAMSDIKTQIYAVLTPAQQAQIPSIIAADRAAHQAKVAAWRSQHSG